MDTHKEWLSDSVGPGTNWDEMVMKFDTENWKGFKHHVLGWHFSGCQGLYLVLGQNLLTLQNKWHNIIPSDENECSSQSHVLNCSNVLMNVFFAISNLFKPEIRIFKAKPAKLGRANIDSLWREHIIKNTSKSVSLTMQPFHGKPESIRLHQGKKRKFWFDGSVSVPIGVNK